MIELLRQLGFSEKEAKVYLAGLELGASSVKKIALQAGVNRTTTHVILQLFIRRGLVTVFESRGRNFFAVEDPSLLQKLVHLKAEEERDRLQRLSRIWPEFSVRYALAKDKPRVRFFEGREEVLKAADLIFQAKEKVLRNVYNVDDLYRVFPKYRRRQTDHEVRTIYNRTAGPRTAEEDRRINRVSSYVSESEYPIASDIDIYDDKLHITSLRQDLMAFFVENREIAETQKSILDLAKIGAEDAK